LIQASSRNLFLNHHHSTFIIGIILYRLSATREGLSAPRFVPRHHCCRRPTRCRLFISAVDPVGAGLVESLVHPGDNATGFMQFDYSLSGKWLETLNQVAPAVTRAGFRDATTYRRHRSVCSHSVGLQFAGGRCRSDRRPRGARDRKRHRQDRALPPDLLASARLAAGSSSTTRTTRRLPTAILMRVPLLKDKRTQK
jgi:hypothetical protein